MSGDQKAIKAAQNEKRGWLRLFRNDRSFSRPQKRPTFVLFVKLCGDPLGSFLRAFLFLTISFVWERQLLTRLSEKALFIGSELFQKVYRVGRETLTRLKIKAGGI